MCVIGTVLLYLLFHYASPGTKSFPELKVTYSVCRPLAMMEIDT